MSLLLLFLGGSAGAAPASGPIGVYQPQPAKPRLVAIIPPGRGYDLTDQAEGLSWSNVNPGGDERCSFMLKRQWFSGAPEIALGNTIRVISGLDVLWQGDIYENDRAVGNAEQIGVTAYGKGIALKEAATYRDIIVDRDLSRWGGASVQRRLNLTTYGFTDPQTVPDATTGAPSLKTGWTGAWTTAALPLAEAVYDAGPGLGIGSVYFAWKRGANASSTDPSFLWQGRLSTDDVLTTTDSTGDLQAAGPGSGTLTAGAANRRFAVVQMEYTTAGGGDGIDYDLFWTCLAVYGNHGLTKRGAASATDAQGFYASDVVPYVVGKVAAIAVRAIDATTFVIPQLAWPNPVTHEQAIIDAARYDQLDWGTWGPNSALDNSTRGYFDMTARDTATQHWFALRSECDDVGLNVESSTLYDSVDVVYADASGVTGVVTRTQAAPDLVRSRKAVLQGGTLTQAGAQQLGDAFLLYSSGAAPARGSVTVSQPIQHYRRGRISPIYMRADGSNLRLPDVLPSKDLFSLTSNPDRRTTFPIKRVSVDCSANTPKVTCELDQSNDTLATLQAQLELAAQVALGH